MPCSVTVGPVLSSPFWVPPGAGELLLQAARRRMRHVAGVNAWVCMVSLPSSRRTVLMSPVVTSRMGGDDRSVKSALASSLHFGAQRCDERRQEATQVGLRLLRSHAEPTQEKQGG